MSKTVLKTVAGVAALAAIAFGASAIAGASGSSSSSSANAPGRMAGPRGGGPPGFGQPVTGSTAAKVKAAALARYPGTVERVMALPNGGYVAHVFRTGGSEVHVLVNRGFQVTGVDVGPPGGGPPPGAAPGRPGSSS